MSSLVAFQDSYLQKISQFFSTDLGYGLGVLDSSALPSGFDCFGADLFELYST